MYTVYGKNECPACFKVKMCLDLLGKEYEYKELDKHLAKCPPYDEWAVAQ